MAYVAHDETAFVPPAEIGEMELYHPKTFMGKYIWSQDAKVIAIQYAITAIGIGLLALVLSWLMRLQLGFPDQLLLYRPHQLPSVRHHARHDHGDLPAHRAVPGRVRQLPHPADGRRARHGVSLCQHAELLDLSGRGVAAGGKLLRARRTHRRRLDPVPAAGNPSGHAGGDRRHRPDARFADVLHHRIHHGRPELCGDGVAGTHAGDDDDAPAPDDLGHFHGHHPGAAGLSRPVRQRLDDAAGLDARHEFLHARHRLEGQSARLRRREPADVSTPVLVFRSSRGLHRRPAGLRHRLRPAQCPREKEHLRLSDDGLGDPGHRRAQFRRVGASHVCQRNEPLLRFLFRHHHPHHRRSHGDQGLQLGSDAVARRHTPHHSDAVRDRLHLRVHPRRVDGPVPRQRDRRACRFPTPCSWSPISTW